MKHSVLLKWSQPISRLTRLTLLLILVLSATFAGQTALAEGPYEPLTREATTRTIAFPANALNYDKTSTIITQYATGLQWQANFQNPAYLTIPKPADWDGTSDVQLRLYFTPKTGTSANVQFFIRPRAFDPGDTFVDASSLSGDPVAVAGANKVYEQLITIPAARFGSKTLWVITIQRQGSLETYMDDLVLLSVGLKYRPTTWWVHIPYLSKP